MNTEGFEVWSRDGCGRCELTRTPECKVLRWTDTLAALRPILLAAGLVEQMKWGNPCYTLGGKNVAMIGVVKAHAFVSFFKGSLLDDPHGVLELPGPASHVGRLVRFTSVDEVASRREVLRALLEQAVLLERQGAKVAPRAAPEPVPDELAAALDADPAARAAFDALTPGRQRSYVLHVADAKGTATRAARAARCLPKIMTGKGFHER